MGGSFKFKLKPKEVPLINTENRKIRTKIPVPESISILEELRKNEPISMRGQPPILWDHAKKCAIFDKYGNQWLDLSSGVLVTNAGHGRKKILDAIINQVNHGLIHNYVFASEIRAECTKKILEFAPEYLNKVFLLTTGSEATENALKLSRTWGQNINPEKNIFISFENAFHGRTLASQQMGGINSLKEWIKNKDPDFIQVPFPDGFYNKDISFNSFIKTLEDKGINPDNVCGVITESYQGGGADFLPVEYVKNLRKWCDDHNVLLIFDEVQAGFGRTGMKFGYMHYEVRADLVCLGKGLSSGLPISGVLGSEEIMDIYPSGSMTSTHTGNPVSCAAVIANLELIEEEKLIENAKNIGNLMHSKLQEFVKKYSIVGVCHGKGLVAGLQIVEPNSRTPDPQKAFEICKLIVERGVMMFSPVGKATLKICPPLCITKKQILEAIEVIDKSIEELSN